jgi:hypothetical protein
LLREVYDGKAVAAAANNFIINNWLSGEQIQQNFVARSSGRPIAVGDQFVEADISGRLIELQAQVTRDIVSAMEPGGSLAPAASTVSATKAVLRAYVALRYSSAWLGDEHLRALFDGYGIESADDVAAALRSNLANRILPQPEAVFTRADTEADAIEAYVTKLEATPWAGLPLLTETERRLQLAGHVLGTR